MTLPVKLLAVLIGLAAGLIGRAAARRHTTVPGIVVVSAAVTAALVGAVTADLTGIDGFGTVALPAAFAALSAGLLILATRRRRHTGRR